MLDGTKGGQHATFWFDDGDLTLTLQHSFRLHAPLLFRNSRAFALWPTQSSDDQGAVNCRLVSVPDEIGLEESDFVVFLEQIYDRGSTTIINGPHQLTTLASLLRVSSTRQLDSPSIYAMACARVEAMFPSGPRPFVHPPCLEMALVLAREHGITSIEKGLFYSLVTTSEFDCSAEEDSSSFAVSRPRIETFPDPTDLPVPRASSTAAAILPSSDAQRCADLMGKIMEHFTPTLFTAPATAHMPCTDAFADGWMTLVVGPALHAGGVYKPLETLEGICGLDWVAHGVCAGCVSEKRDEWREEQAKIWERMDEWLRLGG